MGSASRHRGDEATQCVCRGPMQWHHTAAALSGLLGRTLDHDRDACMQGMEVPAPPAPSCATCMHACRVSVQQAGGRVLQQLSGWAARAASQLGAWLRLAGGQRLLLLLRAFLQSADPRYAAPPPAPEQLPNRRDA